MAILAILAGVGLGIGLYYLLAYSSNLEWSRKDKRFHDWEKKEPGEYNRITHRWEE